jgi:N-sulfoglucosamine sulfohydrolase
MIMKSYYKFLLSLLTMTFFATAADRPNILWLVSEDNGARWLGCYGNPAKPTPTLDKFAAEGFRYTNTHASVPVCAPQRFTWLTGINAISAGTQGMRSNVVIPNQ